MQIDGSEQDAKQDVSIRFNPDSLSNVINPIVDREKHDFPMISIEQGIQID
jgi:hypothetical protein